MTDENIAGALGANAESNVKLFRGKQSVREQSRANHEETTRTLQEILKRLDAIERSL